MRKLALIVLSLFVLTLTAVAQNAPVKRAEPLAHFTVEIDGRAVAGIQPIAGIRETVKETRNHPGSNKSASLKLTREGSKNSTFNDWYKAVIDGKAERRNVSVIFHNDAGDETGHLNYFGCLPTAFTPSISKARNSIHEQESIQLTCESLKWAGK
jgi:phage tail-like protein